MVRWLFSSSSSASRPFLRRLWEVTALLGKGGGAVPPVTAVAPGGGSDSAPGAGSGPDSGSGSSSDGSCSPGAGAGDMPTSASSPSNHTGGMGSNGTSSNPLIAFAAGALSFKRISTVGSLVLPWWSLHSSFHKGLADWILSGGDGQRGAAKTGDSHSSFADMAYDLCALPPHMECWADHTMAPCAGICRGSRC